MTRNFSKTNTNGFTLLEIIVVLTIIGIILVIEAPNIRNYSDNLILRSATQSLVSDLREAQQLTVTEQQFYSIIIDDQSDNYSLIREPATIIKTTNLSSNTSFGLITGLSDGKVSFNFVGAVTDSGSITINEINGASKIINIRPSGYIEIN